jgi:glycosyltransferase involved in cell wall biosynthesis
VANVDVLIPCFNASRYIGAAIDSALGQDLRPARIIVVDDGSTDGSATVVRGYGAPVEYYRQANAGISAARNAAAGRASAEYLAFLDADDLWTERSLSLRLAYLETHPSIDGVFAALSQFISPELEQILAGKFRFDPAPTVARFAGTFLLRRSAFEKVGGFDESLRVGEMIEWLARAEVAGVVTESIRDLALRRRIHDSNTVLGATATQGDYLRAIKGALDRRRGAGQGRS